MRTTRNSNECLNRNIKFSGRVSCTNVLHFDDNLGLLDLGKILKNLVSVIQRFFAREIHLRDELLHAKLAELKMDVRRSHPARSGWISSWNDSLETIEAVFVGDCFSP